MNVVPSPVPVPESGARPGRLGDVADARVSRSMRTTTLALSVVGTPSAEATPRWTMASRASMRRRAGVRSSGVTVRPCSSVSGHGIDSGSIAALSTAAPSGSSTPRIPTIPVALGCVNHSPRASRRPRSSASSSRGGLICSVWCRTRRASSSGRSSRAWSVRSSSAVVEVVRVGDRRRARVEVDDLRGVAHGDLLGGHEQPQPRPAGVGQSGADSDERLGLPGGQGRVVAAQPVAARQPVGCLDAARHELGDDGDERDLVGAPLVSHPLGRGGELGPRVPVRAEPGGGLEGDRLLTVAVGAGVRVRGRPRGGGLDPRRVVDHLVPPASQPPGAGQARASPGSRPAGPTTARAPAVTGRVGADPARRRRPLPAPDQASGSDGGDGIRPAKRSQNPPSAAPPVARCRASRSVSRLLRSSSIVGSPAM